MTATMRKLSNSPAPTKLPKKAASCRRNLKFGVATGSNDFAKLIIATRDRDLQSLESRRKYLRRGSRTPQMMMLLHTQRRTDSSSSADPLFRETTCPTTAAAAQNVFVLVQVPEIGGSRLEPSRQRSTMDKDILPLHDRRNSSASQELLDSEVSNFAIEVTKLYPLKHRRQASVMTALKLNLDKTSISAKPLHRRTSIELVIT